MQPDTLDLYCERTAPGLWNEPLNALTNLAFLLAGLLLVVALRRAGPAVRRDPAILALVALLFLIGLGSGLFHTFATRWAVLADVIPIALFILLYMYLALRRLESALRNRCSWLRPRYQWRPGRRSMFEHRVAPLCQPRLRGPHRPHRW